METKQKQSVKDVVIIALLIVCGSLALGWLFLPMLINSAPTYTGTPVQMFYWNRTAATGVLFPTKNGDDIDMRTGDIFLGTAPNRTTINHTGGITYAGTNRPTAYLYPFDYRSYYYNYAGVAGHAVDVSPDDADPTTATLTNATIKAISYDNDDYAYVRWVFRLPPNFAGFNTTALSLNVLSTSVANTDVRVSLAVNGAFDATVNNLAMNPDNDSVWKTCTSAVGTAWSAANANQEATLVVKFLGDTGNIIRLRAAILSYLCAY